MFIILDEIVDHINVPQSSDEIKMKEENDQLRDENNLLRLKTEILFKMVNSMH